MTEVRQGDALQQGTYSRSCALTCRSTRPKPGKVISQNPTAGTEYGKGQTVTINVGQAQPAPTTTTPTTTAPPTTTTNPGTTPTTT